MPPPPVQAPVGFFDPLGWSKDGDALRFRRRRASELKNGRVAMWAAIGRRLCSDTCMP